MNQLTWSMCGCMSNLRYEVEIDNQNRQLNIDNKERLK